MKVIGQHHDGIERERMPLSHGPERGARQINVIGQ